MASYDKFLCKLADCLNRLPNIVHHILKISLGGGISYMVYQNLFVLF